MPSRLRPTAPLAADAILVGDPGRALLLAQELLEQPRMSNHARGLWGYSGSTPAGGRLTIQSTGMGGPSAGAVLSDLAKLGVRRAVRIGTCAGLEGEEGLGELLLVTGAIATPGSAASFGVEAGEVVLPDAALLQRLRGELEGAARDALLISLDSLPPDPELATAGAAGADMQTVAVLARGRQLGIAIAAGSIVSQGAAGGQLGDGEAEAAAKRLGRAAATALSA